MAAPLVAIASTAGLGGEPMLAAYDAAKFTVVGLVKSLAAEFGPEKVRVNAVCPGAVATDMGRESFAYLANLQGMSIEEAKAMYTSFAALRRSGEAREIASVVNFSAPRTRRTSRARRCPHREARHPAFRSSGGGVSAESDREHAADDQDDSSRLHPRHRFAEKQCADDGEQRDTRSGPNAVRHTE